MNAKLKIAILAISLMVLSISTVSAGLPYTVEGYIWYSDGTTPCNGSDVTDFNIKNTDTDWWWNTSCGYNTTGSFTCGANSSHILFADFDNYYSLTLDDPDQWNNGDNMRFNVTIAAGLNTTNEAYPGDDFWHNITLPFAAPGPQRPDLIVESIDINPSCTSVGDELFVNESNVINATIKNIGTGNVNASDSFDVCFNATNATGVARNISCVNVLGPLNAGQSTTVSISWTPNCTDYPLSTLHPMPGLNCTLKVTADCNCSGCPTCTGNGRINESSEGNNSDVVDTKVYTNGYKSKNYDCNATEKPLTQLEYDDFYGGIVYDVAGEKNYPFSPAETDTRVHPINVPAGMTIEKARLYVYWYDYWGNPSPGHLANLSVNFSGPGGNSVFTSPDALYSDQKGFGTYNTPKGTYAYDVTSLVQGGCNDYTVVVENVDPAASTTLLGELLLVVYNDTTNDPSNKVQLWILEGNDYLMASHGTYQYCVDATESTATVAFPGAITNPGSVSSAILTTVVVQGNEPNTNMLFNGAIVKSGAWDTDSEASPNSKINIEEMDFASIIAASDNTMGFQDNGTMGMQASNAFLIVSEAPRPVITNPSDGDTITGTVWVNETTNATDVVYNLFEYYYDEDCDCKADDGNSWMEIGNDTNGADGWAVQWDTTLLTTGCYMIRATMGDSQGLTGSDEINVKAGTPVAIAVDPDRTLTQPQDQFDVNITLDPKGHGIFGVQYTLKYDKSVLKAESQVTRDFFGDNPSIVVRNEIDQANGLIHYAETLRNDTTPPPCIYDKGTLTTIQFTAIGEPNATSKLNFSDVIIVDCDKEKTDSILDNGTAHIFDNPPPVIECVNATHEKNNAQKKFECWTQLCVNISDSGEKGWNITYVRWSFGDGQYGTAEGGLPDDARDYTCLCKNHSYISWIYNASCKSLMPRPDHNGQDHYVCYDPFNASVTVTDDGCIPETDTEFFDVWVFMTGDANGDGKVNILDAVWIGKHFSQTCDGPAATTHCAGNCGYKWSSNQKSGADLNNDCRINILDAVIVGTMWGHTAY